jgi:hypothetical protein
VNVRNLTTREALSDMSGLAAGTGKFAVTFVDAEGRAVSVGDTLEITVEDTTGRFGTEILRHQVTRDDILSGQLLVDTRLFEIPAESALLANYPNPFNPETWVPFRLSKDAEVRLSIYDATGRLVRTLELGYQLAGVYETKTKAAYWDGRNAYGERVSSGMYFYRLEAGDFTGMRKMLVVK